VLGYAEDVKAVAVAYASGGSRAAAGAASDRPARSLCIAGPLAECRARVAALLRGGADVVVLGLPGATRAVCEPLLAGVIP
jgi:hypothetical protein